MQTSKIMFALPREIMELQLSAIDLLTAMYPSPSELSISSTDTENIFQLRSWIDDEKALPSAVPQILSLTLHLPIISTDSDNETDNEIAHHQRGIQLNISVPLQSEDPDPLDAPAWKWGLRQPDWMSRAQVAALSSNLPTEDIFSAIDYIQSSAPAHIKPSHVRSNLSSAAENEAEAPSGPLARVWFYFPSLSTREKRDDMVRHAPRYGLTGFVLAGKPGVLCLEGTSARVDEYMKFIKTESWGDIPSHQKKVSERYREVDGVQRRFVGMEEITDSLGERRGERANRGDMKALEAWLKDKGLGEAFERVVM